VTDPTSRLDALRVSIRRLGTIVDALDDAAILDSAYPADWSIAQVMSHLGSGAVILQRRLDDELAGTTTPEDFAPQTWDEWNARSARAQVDGGLAADAALLAALEGLSAEQRDEFTFAMGPMSFDFDGFVGLRLNEHAFHTWDIDVSLDPQATVPAPIAGFVVDNLELIGRFTAQPTAGDPATVTARTTDPSGTSPWSCQPRAPPSRRRPPPSRPGISSCRPRRSPASSTDASTPATPHRSWGTRPSSTGCGPPTPGPDPPLSLPPGVAQSDAGGGSNRASSAASGASNRGSQPSRSERRIG